VRCWGSRIPCPYCVLMCRSFVGEKGAVVSVAEEREGRGNVESWYNRLFSEWCILRRLK
jgi:hypothetical protein